MGRREWINEIDSAAKASGVYSPFRYLNYATHGRLVFDGYGAFSKARLQAVSRAYDPHGFFQQALPGGIEVFAP